MDLVSIKGASDKTMRQTNFSAHHHGCFHIKLSNNLVISILIAPMSYSDNYNLMPTTYKRWTEETLFSDTAEIAVWVAHDHKDKELQGKYVTYLFFKDADRGESSIAAYVTIKEFESALVKMIAWNGKVDEVRL